MSVSTLTVAVAQVSPAWLDRARTLDKVVDYAGRAADAGAGLVAFGEALVPGYPFWLALTDGAVFESKRQKTLHAHYLDQAVDLDAGHLDRLCELAADRGIAVYLGCIERPADRGGHSVYATLVYIGADGTIGSAHRKLMPTYEERLAWSPGDGHGLRVHSLPPFIVGGLNCWENWMPLPRAALYGQGEDLHVAVWPGGLHNTHDITRFIAREGRSFVVSASGLMKKEGIGDQVPYADEIRTVAPETLANGGSCIAGPDGAWVVEPVLDEETLITATLDHARVREERQNFDPVGHYSRPDVTILTVNRTRQQTVRFD